MGSLIKIERMMRMMKKLKKVANMEYKCRRRSPHLPVWS